MDEATNGVRDMLRSEACGFAARALRGEGEDRTSDPARLMEMLARTAAAGYPGMLSPVSCGGEGGGLLEACIVVEEIAAGEPTLALMLLHHLSCTLGLALWADEGQRQSFLPRLCSLRSVGGVALTEPEAGSDLGAIKASLSRRGEHLELEGNKCFVTNTGEDMDSLLLGFFRGAAGLACALVPSSAPGFHLAHHYRFAGWDGLPNHAIVLQDCSVPAEHLIAEVLTEERLEPWWDGSLLLVTALATGMMRACREKAARYCGERRQFGRRLLEHQALLFRLSDMAVCETLTRTGMELAAARMDAGAPRHAEICMLKLFASGRLEEVASSALEMTGGYGYTVDSGLSALYRDAKGLQLLWGTREMMRLEIARSLRAARHARLA